MNYRKEHKKRKKNTGVDFEKTVCRIQQMMDQNSVVTRNEWLVDRLGNKRQYDVIIRGKYAGRPFLGIIECKDHKRRIGPSAIEAFAKKTENLGTNLRMVVSKMGFTKKALKVAKHEHIDCLSLLSEDQNQVWFNIGQMIYGVMRRWTSMRLRINYAMNKNKVPRKKPEITDIKYQGKLILNWFIKELCTTHADESKEGVHYYKSYI